MKRRQKQRPEGLRNKFEEKLWDQLSKGRRKVEYESEEIPYILSCVYKPDFIVGNGLFYIEGKGKFDSVARRKMAEVGRQHPLRDIRIVFYNANSRISKQSRTTYGEWATKHGFKWADKDIPLSWLKE